MNAGGKIFGFRLWFLVLAAGLFLVGLFWVNRHSQYNESVALASVETSPNDVLASLNQQLVHKDNSLDLLGLGYRLAKRQEYDLAVVVLRRAQVLRPGSRDIQGLLAWTLTQQLNHTPALANREALQAEARRAAGDAQTIDPQSPWVQELQTDLGSTASRGKL